MAKFMILFFLTSGGAVFYSTYKGVGQETLETLKHETVRSNSYHSGSTNGGGYGGSYGSTGSYNSGGYSYGK